MMSSVGSSLTESGNQVEVALNVTINSTPKPLRGLGSLRAERSGASYRGFGSQNIAPRSGVLGYGVQG